MDKQEIERIANAKRFEEAKTLEVKEWEILYLRMKKMTLEKFIRAKTSGEDREKVFWQAELDKLEQNWQTTKHDIESI